ncbi:MAG TPA: hypothetical protein VJY35_11970 [Candidatus Eisenbacteria bacterium]|nr:hypothetical protein [Candidatus Eisenbacteria bacterium]
MAGTGTDALTHNERFTHFFFPRVVFEWPDIWFDMLRSNEGTEQARKIWNALGARIAQSGEGPAISAAGVNAIAIDGSCFQGAVISFPPPTRVTGCHMIALVRSTKRKWFGVGPQPASHYFTLERSEGMLDGSVGQVLGEWKSRARVNYGECPSPSMDVFLAAIADVLSGKRKPQSMHATTRFQES